jgi:hypothetical protein
MMTDANVLVAGNAFPRWPYEVKDPSKRAVKKNLHLVRSAKDVPVALAAKRARVQYLVSNDKDLTVQDVSTEQIRQWFAPLLPAVFLRDVMGWTSEELEAIRHRTWEDLAAGA